MMSNTDSRPYIANAYVPQFAVRGRLTANNCVALMQATAQGMGISLQPDFLAAPFLVRQEVVEILGAFESPQLGIYAVLPRNRYILHRVGVLIEYLAVALKGASAPQRLVQRVRAPQPWGPLAARFTSLTGRLNINTYL